MDMDYGLRHPDFLAPFRVLARVCPLPLNCNFLRLKLVGRNATQQHDARLLDTPPPPACCVYNETLPVDFGVEMGGKAGYESVFEDYYAAEGSGRESGEHFTCNPFRYEIVNGSWFMHICWIWIWARRRCCSRRKAWIRWRILIRLWLVLRVYGESSSSPASRSMFNVRSL